MQRTRLIHRPLNPHRHPTRRVPLVAIAGFMTLTGASLPLLSRHALADANDHRAAEAVLVGRAVLPVDTYAPGPVSGQFFGGTTTNGITFPLPSQPVEGFSAIIDGRHAGELLAMPDNGFGTKANSFDFFIRAYYLEPSFKTAGGGTGDVIVGDHIQFRDPSAVIGFPIINSGTTDRLLTGSDIDPESLQRDHKGDLWVGDEFGPWILHFDSAGVLLDPPFAVPGLMSPNNPFLNGSAPSQPNSRGFEAMAISPDGRFLYAALEGATVADGTTTLRRILEFDIRAEALTGREWAYHTEAPGHLVADMAALDSRQLVLIERDAGRGLTALFRSVYRINIDEPAGQPLSKKLLVDLTHIPDPDLISLPPLHTGDVGLGDPFSVVCESVEAVHPVRGHELVIGCDNNFPNTGRNPLRADDNEFIVVDLSTSKAG